MGISLISHFLPQDLLEYFELKSVKELCNVKEKTVYFELCLEEKNVLLGIFNGKDFESKGFTEVTLQDFPIRGKAVYLLMRRRRWRHKKDPKIIHRNDFSFVAEGSGFTKELSNFLKGTG